MAKSCFFIGSHDIGNEIYPALLSAVERHIAEYGVKEFFVGHYGRFDSLAAKAVLEAKKCRPDIILTLVLPYHPAACPFEKPDGFDGTYYPWASERIPNRFAIVRTNRHMADTCDHLIACAKHSFGSSAKLIAYAQRRASRGLIRVTELSVTLSK